MISSYTLSKNSISSFCTFVYINDYVLQVVSVFNMYLVFFSFFQKKIPIVVVRDACPSVRRAVHQSVEIISFRGISISNRPIDLKMSMNVRRGVVHVRKA